MTETRTDKWMVLKIPSDPPFYKVFATWGGGYLTGDSWRLNSGIKRVEEDGEHLLFHGNSGSVYRCHKEMYGVAGAYNYPVLESLIKKGCEELDEDTEWTSLIKEESDECTSP